VVAAEGIQAATPSLVRCHVRIFLFLRVVGSLLFQGTIHSDTSILELHNVDPAWQDRGSVGKVGLIKGSRIIIRTEV
jgi:hypothetical protein